MSLLRPTDTIYCSAQTMAGSYLRCPPRADGHAPVILLGVDTLTTVRRSSARNPDVFGLFAGDFAKTAGMETAGMEFTLVEAMFQPANPPSPTTSLLSLDLAQELEAECRRTHKDMSLVGWFRWRSSPRGGLRNEELQWHQAVCRYVGQFGLILDPQSDQVGLYMWVTDDTETVPVGPFSVGKPQPWTPDLVRGGAAPDPADAGPVGLSDRFTASDGSTWRYHHTEARSDRRSARRGGRG
jgi:hypothetical protein